MKKFVMAAVVVGVVYGAKADEARLLPESLAETAARLERLIDEKFVDPDGVLYSQLDENWRSFQLPLPADEEVMIVPGATANEAGMRNYENTGMVQGEFLAAMCAKYRATGDPSALEKARRTYRGIRHVYALSTAFKGKGYYCKPWGGVAQPETSSDQYIYTLYGLDRYYSFAPADEQKDIRKMIVDMVEYWPRHDYRQLFLGRELKWQLCRFLSFLQLGVKYGPSELCHQELNRLRSDSMVTNDVPFKGSLRFGRRTRPDGLEVQSVNAENAFSGFLSVFACLEANSRDAYAMRILPELFAFAEVALAPEGNGYRYLVADGQGGWTELPATETRFYPAGREPPWNWTLFGLSGPVRYGGQSASLGTAAMALLAPYLPRAEVWCRQHAADRLAKIADGHLTWYEDPHGILPPRLKWITHVRSGDAVCGWLLAYWTLRCGTWQSVRDTIK